MTKEEFLSRVWGYYIMLENNFMDTFVYVEPVTENNDTFSKEYGKLLLSIGFDTHFQTYIRNMKLSIIQILFLTTSYTSYILFYFILSFI